MSDSDVLLDVQNTAEILHPKVIVKDIQYGTAGFRTKANDLDCVVFRMGLLAALRSRVLSGAAIGVMITASHNPEEDNGVKLVDPMGEMLETSWEKAATHLGNVSNDLLAQTLEHLVTVFRIDLSRSANVLVACDTRISSPSLVKAVIDGARLLNAEIKDFGYLTTPQLHYMVRCTNSKEQYGVASEDGYFKKIGSAFVKLASMESCGSNYSSKIKIDGANGVGALKISYLEDVLNGILEMELCNDGKNGRLNHMCGADFVKIIQKAPEGMLLEPNIRCLSLDGDADRIIYFYIDEENNFHMLDGDKISALVTGFLQKLVADSGLELNVMVVQTAYANGSSTKYIQNKLKVPVACVPTGVKHLHHKAQEADVGIYFEANGHGTVVFSDNAIRQITEVASNENNAHSETAQKLIHVIDLINQTTGDALSDMLLVETVLRTQNWGIADWNSIYKDLPNRQIKVVVKDRNAITTTDAERRCVTPFGLQEAIDALVKGKNNYRAFVRPSGTEDMVRVYAEADTQLEADNLAHQIGLRVFQLAAGIGPEPKPL